MTVVRMPEFNVGTWLAGAAAFLAAIAGANAPELVIWIFVLMGADLLAGLIRALLVSGEDVCPKRFAGGVLGKMLLVLLLVPAAGVDRVLQLTLPLAGVEIGDVVPLTFAVLIGLVMHECGSIVRNISAAIGDTWVARRILHVIRAF